MLRLLLLGLLLPALVHARPAVLDGLDLEPEGVWSTRLTFFASMPVALASGMPTGAALEGVRRIGSGPFHAGLSLAFSSSTEANPSWELRHRHASASLVAGASRSIGIGRLFAQAAAGVVHVSERARRHQYDRLVALGVPDLERNATAFGPLLHAEAGVSVQLRAGFQIVVSAGPTWKRLTVGGVAQSRWGALAGAGVRRAF